VKALYIGIQTPGTTAQLRGETLKRTLPYATWSQINTDSVFLTQPRWSRTLAFRLRTGPAVSAINHLVQNKITGHEYDLVWIDKAVYLWPETVRTIRSLTKTLVHYTPDTAFFANGSRFFNDSANLYDKVVTTKSFELEDYTKLVAPDRLMLVTQSFDNNLHNRVVPFQEKRKEVVLIGLCEPDREACVAQLLSKGLAVRVGGKNWDRFRSRYQDNPLFHFEGQAVFGEQYVECLSKASIGLGLLTKRFPEQHTTRTFEIPACGTIVATVRNAETSSFFNDNEAIFYRDYQDLAQKAEELLHDPKRLQEMTMAGQQRIRQGGFSNEDVLCCILDGCGFKTAAQLNQCLPFPPRP
jgi:spore maturation protein CgeB